MVGKIRELSIMCLSYYLVYLEGREGGEEERGGGGIRGGRRKEGRKGQGTVAHNLSKLLRRQRLGRSWFKAS
jgi:hypothetical protein